MRSGTKRPLKSSRLIRIIKRLRARYLDDAGLPRYLDPFKILIVTMLSAQCTDERANKVASDIFKKYKNVGNLARAKRPVLEREIYSAGFYKNKAKNIIAASKKILKDYKGTVPDTMHELLTLPGVGRKTANIVLSHAFNKTEGIAVDTHVKRLSSRLGLTTKTDPGKIEQDLIKIIPKNHWLDFNYILVRHGKEVCRSKTPLCNRCIIKYLCPSYRGDV